MQTVQSDKIPEKIDWKPVIFSAGTPPGLRRAYISFIILCCVALVMIIWPVASIFNRGDIIVLGLPLNLLWLVFWKATIFSGLIWLYRFEYFRKRSA